MTRFHTYKCVLQLFHREACCWKWGWEWVTPGATTSSFSLAFWQLYSVILLKKLESNLPWALKTWLQSTLFSFCFCCWLKFCIWGWKIKPLLVSHYKTLLFKNCIEMFTFISSLLLECVYLIVNYRQLAKKLLGSTIQKSSFLYVSFPSYSGLSGEEVFYDTLQIQLLFSCIFFCIIYLILFS